MGTITNDIYPSEQGFSWMKHFKNKNDYSEEEETILIARQMDGAVRLASGGFKGATLPGEYDSQALKASCAALPEGQLSLLCAIGRDAT